MHSVLFLEIFLFRKQNFLHVQYMYVCTVLSQSYLHNHQHKDWSSLGQEHEVDIAQQLQYHLSGNH